MERLAGKGIWVTGAAQGLGEVIARRAVAEGALVVVADVKEDAGRAVADDLGPAAVFIRLDITDDSSWAQAVPSVLGHLGQLDGIVNNAAILWMGSLESMSTADAERVMRVNLLGTFLGIRTAVAPLRAAGGGSIVNISSIDGLAGMNSVAMYSATKFAVRGLTKSAALELGRDGIRVNTVCPAMGNPEMSMPWFDQFDLDRYLARVQQPAILDDGIPRTVDADAVASMVLFLLSDESRTCSGGDYPVDAAWTAGKLCPGLPGF